MLALGSVGCFREPVRGSYGSVPAWRAVGHGGVEAGGHVEAGGAGGADADADVAGLGAGVVVMRRMVPQDLRATLTPFRSSTQTAASIGFIFAMTVSRRLIAKMMTIQDVDHPWRR